MGLFDNIVDAAKSSVSNKTNEIGGYLDSVITGVFVKAGEPAKGNQTVAPAAAPAQVISAASAGLGKYAIPLAIAGVAVAALLFMKRK